MAKGFHKKQSKRVPAKRRYKIEKKVKEHNRKLRKHSKKNPSFKSKKEKPFEIPNSLPFKEKIIQEIQQHQQQEQEHKKTTKLHLKQLQSNLKNNIKVSNLETLAADAEQRFDAFKEQDISNNKELNLVSEGETSNLRSFYKEFKKVVEAADVIVEVLDARDPLGTRCSEVETLVRKENHEKKIVLLLNKVDLIPKSNAEQWLKYLRNEYPTILFKASTQSQRQNLGRSKSNLLLVQDSYLQTSKCFGADDLIKLLNKYCHNKDIKTSISVGIVGMPNVGKSSIINSLKRSQVCTVGSTPGLTKHMQSIALDKHIKLLDSPGVVFAKNSSGNENEQYLKSIFALRNAVNIDTLDDPIQPVEALLLRLPKQELMSFYRLTDFNDVREFLQLVAKRFGKMLKGAMLDIHAAAKKVLYDWNCGKIKYYTLVPEKDTNISSEIVYQISKEFDIDNYDSNKDSMEVD